MLRRRRRPRRSCSRVGLLNKDEEEKEGARLRWGIVARRESSSEFGTGMWCWKLLTRSSKRAATVSPGGGKRDEEEEEEDGRESVRRTPLLLVVDVVVSAGTVIVVLLEARQVKSRIVKGQ